MIILPQGTPIGSEISRPRRLITFRSSLYRHYPSPHLERIVAFLTQSMVWTQAIKGEFARLGYDNLLQANHRQGCVCRGLQRLCEQG